MSPLPQLRGETLKGVIVNMVSFGFTLSPAPQFLVLSSLGLVICVGSPTFTVIGAARNGFLRKMLVLGLSWYVSCWVFSSQRVLGTLSMTLHQTTEVNPYYRQVV